MWVAHAKSCQEKTQEIISALGVPIMEVNKGSMQPNPFTARFLPLPQGASKASQDSSLEGTSISYE